MKTSFDTDAILFQLLNGKTSINGGVYTNDDRPENSEKEDIVVNTIDLSQDSFPQIGTSNVNIYVPDSTKRIKGKEQIVANRIRMKSLTNEIIAILRKANVNGLKLIPGNMSTMYEPRIKQHFVNIRIYWNIQN